MTDKPKVATKQAGHVASIGLGGINVRPDRMRRLRPEVVADIAESFRQIGQLQPIVVRSKPGGGYWLVAGLHRFEAAKKLKWPSISAIIIDAGDDTAELAEIDENLARADLSPAERAMHIGRRKALFERLHPATRHGGDRRSSSRKNCDLKTRFTADAAAKTGRSERSVQRDAAHAADVKVLADVVGTSLDNDGEIEALSKLPEQEQRKLASAAKAGKKVSARNRTKQIRREGHEKALAEKQLALPTKKYNVINCDDEWDHRVWSRETGLDRHASNHYVTASDAHTAEEMHERTKARFECAADDCLLAMWSTVQHLAIAIELLRLRGFDYVSHYVWGKNKAGMGRWNRNKHEILLLGVKGKIPCPAPGKQWDSLIMAKATKHSAKPECFLEMLEEYFPNLPKIELNRRGPPRPGWDSWGAEAS